DNKLQKLRRFLCSGLLRACVQTYKTAQGYSTRSEFGFAPELALTLSGSIRTNSSDRETTRRSRGEGVLPPRVWSQPGIRTAMSETSQTKSESGLGETVRVIIHALIIALVIRTFLFQPFNIPSGSMEGTLLVGDYLFVSKYSYGYSHYSLPLSPRLFKGRIFGSDPKRGDVVVFRLPKNDSIDFIKRVI